MLKAPEPSSLSGKLRQTASEETTLRGRVVSIDTTFLGVGLSRPVDEDPVDGAASTDVPAPGVGLSHPLGLVLSGLSELSDSSRS